MDKEILKLILNSQGSVDREVLECDLGDVSFITQIISSSRQLVPCWFSGTQKVVARSKVRLCPAKECRGCGGLHLCKNILLSGACAFLQTRRGCSFSHELHTEYNLQVLREFGLETLNRTELCLLLLQSNNSLLPQICHDYNNSWGCWVDCQRLHVCERTLSGDSCSCTRKHSFSAPQPLRLLLEKHIPEHLIGVLKSVYANKKALRLADQQHKDNSSQVASSSDAGNPNKVNDTEQDDTKEDTQIDFAACDSDSSSISTNQNKSTTGNNDGPTKKRNRRRNRQKNKTPAVAAAASGHGGLELSNTNQCEENVQDPNTTMRMCEGSNPDSSSTLTTSQSKDRR
ncbi:hypothetical protein WMY93_021639 [Mugilogobius chulae]|uniref:PARP12-like CCCH zinc finger tandem domain-containing protein n=1 Tax=Mugilogobius chulae TaxID=88201 RepID=A0AAW0NLD5_9GOBI